MKTLFDLNIEKVLEHWEAEHAIREIIANALDEKDLTKTKEIDIFQVGNSWHIRDYGRGLKDTHFTQNENYEKFNSPDLIGKFGVGLKDALAVFHRKNITVTIDSKYAHITLEMANKTGFTINTLHAVFSESVKPEMEGTEFCLTGVSEDAINKAKEMFLQFSHTEMLEKTFYGEVHRTSNKTPSIYINGVCVAKESNFLFSYNITHLNAQIKKALNRERTNVGRSAYSESIKTILRQCTNESVLFLLVQDLENVMKGTNKDESNWLDVATHAAQILNKKEDVVFMSPHYRSTMTNQQVEILHNSQKKLVMVTDTVFEKTKADVTTYETILEEYNDAFIYNFIDYDLLSESEKIIFSESDFVINFLKKHGYTCDIPIRVSATIRLDTFGIEANGVFDKNRNEIIIKRSTLQSKSLFNGVLAHEIIHYASGYEDNTRGFESALTDIIGLALNKLNPVEDKSLNTLTKQDTKEKITTRNKKLDINFNDLSYENISKIMVEIISKAHKIHKKTLLDRTLTKFGSVDSINTELIDTFEGIINRLTINAIISVSDDIISLEQDNT